MGLYEDCSATNDTSEAILRCISSGFDDMEKHREEDLRQWLLVLCGSLVLFMQAGFAMLCAGSVRKKNAQNTLLKNLLDACGSALAYYCVGYAFAFGEPSTTTNDSTTTTTTFVGNSHFFGPKVTNDNSVDIGFWFFQYTFSAASVTIVAGTLAERCQMRAYLLYSFFLSGFVYPVVAHGVWSGYGYLSAGNSEPFLGVGMIDFAGSGVVHLTGGSTALYAAYILGSRRGRFYDIATGAKLDTPKEIRGHSMSLVMLGTGILWFGWYGFNAGSALLIADQRIAGQVASHVAVNTSLAGATGGVTVLVTHFLLEKRRTGKLVFDFPKIMNGTLSGLVAITAGCATVETGGAIAIAIVAGWLYLFASDLLIRFKIDDAVDAIPVHMVNGAWGVLSTGFFSSHRLMQLVNNGGPTTTAAASEPTLSYAGVFYSFGGRFTANRFDSVRLLTCQLLGILFVLGWTFITMVPFFLLLNRLKWFRTESVSELVGLDRLYHGETAHDDAIEDIHIERDKAVLDALKQYHTRRQQQQQKHQMKRRQEPVDQFDDE